jgi:hypothetical protein
MSPIGEAATKLFKNIAIGGNEMRTVELRFDCPCCGKGSIFKKVEGALLTIARAQSKKANLEIYQCKACDSVVATDYRLPVEVCRTEVVG